MGVLVEIVDLNRWFATLQTQPLLVNDFDISSDDTREQLNQLMYSHYEGDTLNVVPQCKCGNLSGAFLIDVTCPVCHVQVRSVTERELEPILWCAPPSGVHTLMNPQCWTMLTKAMKYGSLNLLEHLCNPNMAMPQTQPKEAQRYLQLKIPRGINYFYEHFDVIMGQLFDNNLIYANKPRRLRDEFRQFLEENRGVIFARYLPCPSRLSLITEKTVISSYSDPSNPKILDAILTISTTENSTRPLSLEVKQARATEAIKKFAEYHQDVRGTTLFKKEGWARKHLFGTRSHWTFRGVITSLSENHIRDELHIPWSMAVMVLEFHLYNKLLKRNYSPTECTLLINESVLQYNPLIDSLFTEMIDESPYDGILCTLGRNPTLVRGSIQLLRITRIEKDPKINAISLSVLALKAPNADFDGDELNGTIILDHDMYARLQRLHPDHYVIDLEKPRSLSGYIGLPSPVLATIGAWMHQGK